MRRAILAHPDGVVGKHENRLLAHQRRHAHRVARVLHEDQESRAVVDEAPVQGDAVHDGRHAKFAHTVIDVVARRIASAVTGVESLHRVRLEPARSAEPPINSGKRGP